jgi:hypothetical protein
VAGTLAPGEKLWRMVEYGWYQAGAVQEAAFIGEISLVRISGVSVKDVDAVKDHRTGAYKFLKYGILELDADSILRVIPKCSFRITAEPDWPADSHVIFIRASGGKTLSGKHLEGFRADRSCQ